MNPGREPVPQNERLVHVEELSIWFARWRACPSEPDGPQQPVVTHNPKLP